MNKGVTILPELAILELNARKRKKVRRFKPPVLVREIIIVTYRQFVKQRMIEVLGEEICNSVTEEMHNSRRKQITLMD